MKNFPKKYKLGDILLIEWFDAFTDTGWKSPRTLRENNACLCYSIGLYIGENKNKDVLIAGTWDTAKDEDVPSVNNVSGRPLGMIQKVTLIRKGKKS